MKKFLVDFGKSVVTFLISLIAPLVLVVIGALLVGYGSYKEWAWMTGAGVLVAALGLIIMFRYWWFDD